MNGTIVIKVWDRLVQDVDIPEHLSEVEVEVEVRDYDVKEADDNTKKDFYDNEYNSSIWKISSVVIVKPIAKAGD